MISDPSIDIFVKTQFAILNGEYFEYDEDYKRAVNKIIVCYKKLHNKNKAKIEIDTKK